MLCIPTQVQLPFSDPEFSSAIGRLLDGLQDMELGTGRDPIQANGTARWIYLGSIPRRAVNGSIEYRHIFQHDRHPLTAGPLTLSVAASRKWWPDAACRSLAPAPSARRADLRLVS
jgi:hypothetical protein